MGTTPSDRLYLRVRAAIEATPAPAMRTRTQIFAALALVPLSTAAVVLIASELVYGQPVAGLDIDVSSLLAMSTTLGLLAGLAAASTLFALWQGRDGLGVGSISLLSIVTLV